MDITFGDWLKNQIKQKGMTQAELAKRIKVTPSLISHLLAGDRGTTTENIVAIARALNIPPEEVFRASAGIVIPNPNRFTEKAEHIINSFKMPETKEKALNFLEYLATQEEKGEYLVTQTSKDAGED